jgi:hypothetical protein
MQKLAILAPIFTLINALISAAVSWTISRLSLQENVARELLSESLAVQA